MQFSKEREAWQKSSPCQQCKVRKKKSVFNCSLTCEDWKKHNTKEPRT